MFVVCGEALMDVFAHGETPGGLALDARIGGSPFNVALGLARLAQPVCFFGGMSRGFVGERLPAPPDLGLEGARSSRTVKDNSRASKDMTFSFGQEPSGGAVGARPRSAAHGP